MGRWWRRKDGNAGQAADPGPDTSDEPAPGVLMVERYDQVRSVLRDAERFRVTGSAIECGQVRPLLPLQAELEDHPRFREPLEEFFKPANLATFEPALRREANRLIDVFASEGATDVNLHLARPFPVVALAVLLDLDPDDWPRLQSFHDGILDPGPDVEDLDRHRHEIGAQVYAYFEPIVAARRGTEGSDLIRFLQSWDGPAGRVTDEEVVDHCYLLTLAGIDPVTRAIATAVAHLGSDPASRSSLLADHVALRRTTEELLRWGSVVKVITRIATEPAELDGLAVQAGRRLGCSLHAANHDPQVFADPERFDPSRPPGKHLSFGAGPHRCVGAHLARQQVRVALEVLHERLPDHRLAESSAHLDAADMDPRAPLEIVFSPA